MRGGGGGGGRGMGGGMRRGGGLAAAAEGSKLREELGLQAEAATAKEMVEIFRPYFKPSGRRERLLVLLCYALLGASKACTLVAPLVLGLATDAMVHGSMPTALLCAYALLRFSSGVLEEGQRFAYQRVKEVAYLETARAAYAHVTGLSYTWHVNKRSGAVLRAMDRGISSASTMIDMVVLRLGPTIVEALIVCVLFLTQYGSPTAAGILFTSFVGYFVVTYWFQRQRSKIRSRMNTTENEAAQLASDALLAFEVVSAFSAGQRETARYADAVARAQKLTKDAAGSLVALNSAQSAVIRAAVLGVLLAAAADVVAGTMSIGGFVALQAYTAQVFQPLSWLGTLYTLVSGALVDLGNLAALLKEQPTVTDAPDAVAYRPPPDQAGVRVEVRGLSFAYPPPPATAALGAAAARSGGSGGAPAAGSGGALASVRRWLLRMGGGRAGAVELRDDSDALVPSGAVGISIPSRSPGPSPGGALQSALSPTGGGSAGDRTASPSAPGAPVPRPVLSAISFTIEPGQTVAAVGSTGSGKSTLARLLLRFLDPTSGAILVDGLPLRSIAQASWRGAAVAYTPQEGILFNGTLGYNIRYGRPDASEDDVRAVVAAAQLETLLARLPEGLHTRVGERGLRLSGGEKQRVALARALLCSPSFIILDEATSALDSLTEREVQAAIASASKGRSCFVVAHRLSTIRDADCILVLEEGRIIERGTHGELLALGGRYAALWRQQAEAAALDAAAAAAAEAGEGAPASVDGSSTPSPHAGRASERPQAAPAAPGPPAGGAQGR